MTKIVEKFAILLIDAYNTDTSQCPDLETESGNMSAVLQQANITNIPVFEIRPCTFGIGIGKLCNRTNPIFTNLSASNWQQIDKLGTSAFDGTELKIALDVAGITSLIIMGYHEHVCVKDTVEAAVSRGYQVYTSLDLVQGDRTDPYDTSDKIRQKEVKEFYNTWPTLLKNCSEVLELIR